MILRIRSVICEKYLYFRKKSPETSRAGEGFRHSQTSPLGRRYLKTLSAEKKFFQTPSSL